MIEHRFRLRAFAVITATTAASLLWPAASMAAPGATCAGDADCGADEACKVTGGSASGGSDCGPIQPGAEEQCQQQEPEITEERTCVTVPRPCTSDAECPFPTKCLEADAGDVAVGGGTGGSTGSGGDVAEAPPDEPATRAQTVAAKVCTWAPKSCESDAECTDAGFECLEVGRAERCSDPGSNDGGKAGDSKGSAGGSSGSGTGGSTGTATKTQAQTCTVEKVFKACFPKIESCTGDAACMGGWSCYQLGDEFEDAPFYQEGQQNNACVPEGVALAFDGKAALDGSAFGYSAPARGGIGESDSYGGATAGGDDQRADGDEESATGKGGGCSLGGGSGIADAWWLCLALLAVIKGRRRA